MAPARAGFGICRHEGLKFVGWTIGTIVAPFPKIIISSFNNSGSAFKYSAFCLRISALEYSAFCLRISAFKYSALYQTPQSREVFEVFELFLPFWGFQDFGDVEQSFII